MEKLDGWKEFFWKERQHGIPSMDNNFKRPQNVRSNFPPQIGYLSNIIAGNNPPPSAMLHDFQGSVGKDRSQCRFVINYTLTKISAKLLA